MRLFLLFCSLSFGFLSCFQQSAETELPKPESVIMTEKDNPRDSFKQDYKRKLYFAAPGTNVDSIREENWKRFRAIRQERRATASRSTSESFANGLLTATWHERGSTNEAGDMRVIDFYPATEDFYAISTVGHLWKGNLNGNTWTLLNDDIRFRTEEIAVMPHNSGVRIFAAYGTGTNNKKIRFSDDNGLNWTTGSGFQFYDHWGSGRRLYTLSDNQTLYYLVHTWSGSPWGQLIQLYRSTDKGVSYTKVWDTPVGYESEDVDLWKPYGSDQMYLVDNRAQKFHTVSHNFSNGATTISAPVNYSSQGVTTGRIHVSGRYNTSLGANELFICHEASQKVYKTSNGANWTYLSTASENIWVKGWLADPDNNNLYVGGFQLNKSLNGINWQEQYPQWWRYYSHSKDSMHVDIMNLKYFKKSNGTPFIIILNHAGVHVTYDHFQTTANLGLTDLNVVTLYDQTTATDGFLYCGAQDKGTFVHTGNSKANFNQLSTINRTTGDGMIGAFFNNEQSMYAMLQNGGLQILPNRASGGGTSYNIPGNHKPGWINPMVGTPNLSDNVVYLAGGNINGGDGSYLIRLNTILSPSLSYQVSQYNYDFRANSGNATSVIKAIMVADSDPNRLYVATEDATFFYSTDQGTSWSKSVAAGLPATMIPWDIKCPPGNANTVYICGTGFSNSGVYRSTNGGLNFSALSGNIPAATFYEIALSTDENFLFAATSEGPYVYAFSTSQWYPLIGAETPYCDFNTVDNIGNNVMRFGTYGRGVWDLELYTPLPVSLLSFDARLWGTEQARLQWQVGVEQGVKEYVVERSSQQLAFAPIGSLAANGASDYSFTDENPLRGDNYYRLLIRDRDGSTAYSPVRKVAIDTDALQFKVFPTLLYEGASLQIKPSRDATYTFELYDNSGRLVLQRQINGDAVLPDMPGSGNYMYQIRSGNRRQSGRLVVY